MQKKKKKWEKKSKTFFLSLWDCIYLFVHSLFFCFFYSIYISRYNWMKLLMLGALKWNVLRCKLFINNNNKNMYIIYIKKNQECINILEANLHMKLMLIIRVNILPATSLNDEMKHFVYLAFSCSSKCWSQCVRFVKLSAF